MHRLLRVAACLVLAARFGMRSVGPAAAHEGREVANGQYHLIVGFLDEPAFAGENDAMIVEISKSTEGSGATPAAGGEEGTPVEGLVGSIQAEAIYGDQRLTLQLVPLVSQPGAYVGYFFPMAEGDYSFRVTGQIEGNASDETFTAGPETFASVEPRTPYELPQTSAKGAGTVGSPLVLGAAGLAAAGFAASRMRRRPRANG